MDFYVHESSVVDVGARVGKGSKIWHFTHVFGDSVIGDGCVIGQSCMVGSGVLLGNYVKVQNGVSLFSGVECGDYSFIGPNAVFTNVINPRSFIDRKSEFKKTMVGFGATIGANATILCGTAIGDYAMVGAGSVVTRDVPNHAIVVGNPAKLIGFVDKAGLRLKEGLNTDSYDGTVYELKGSILTVLKTS